MTSGTWHLSFPPDALGSVLSTTPKFVLSWQWDLCEPSMKRDPRSLPFWDCLASTMTCIVRSGMHSFCTRAFFHSPISVSLHYSQRRILFRWAQMSGFPLLLFLTGTTRPNKNALTSVQHRHRRCFRKKNKKEKGEEGREKRGGRRRKTWIVKSKIAVTSA